MMKIIWSPTARSKTRQILEYISKDNTDAALALIDQIEEKVEELRKNPLVGRVLPETNNQSIREIVVRKNYGVIYEVFQNSIEILTVRHFRQDFSISKL
ncbi:MAG: type II toxin-antitoxin system RelE/ParE family toxin [Balneola sp.]